MQTKGFTLIELLIIIGIIAVLATSVVLIINPVKILAETRDVQRSFDLNTVKAAIDLAVYGAVSGLNFPTGPGCSFTQTASDPQVFPWGNCSAPTTADLRKIDGNGWMKINLGPNSSISVLPTDPIQNQNYSYHYKGSNTINGTFELNGRLESVKYRDQMVNDGGNANFCPSTYQEQTCWYEVGTNLTL